MDANIVVVGSLNMDMVIRVDAMPFVGETILGGAPEYMPGGKGANQAAAIAKLGGNVAMIGCVGTDSFGDKLLNNLRGFGVDYSGVERTSDTSGLAVIYVDKLGNNSIVVSPGANLSSDSEYVAGHRKILERADIVLIQMEIPQDAIFYVIREAKKLGKTVILNPAPVPENIPDEILGLVDYITPNESEAIKLAGGKMTPEEAAAVLYKRGAKKVLVTLGERGAYFYLDGLATYYNVRKVQAVDTTAAGDCFNGAFAVALAKNLSEPEAIAFANCAASIAVTRVGAQSSLPSYAEVLGSIRKE